MLERAIWKHDATPSERSERSREQEVPATRLWCVARLATSQAPRAEVRRSETRRGLAVIEVTRRWFKQLRDIDAQQPGAGHISNTMTLVAAGHPVNTQTYFRDDF